MNLYQDRTYVIYACSFLIIKTHHLWLEITTYVIKALGRIGENLVSWFSNIQIELNIDKCHLLSQEPNALKIGDTHINKSLSEKLLGINFDCKLKLNKHIEEFCRKASRKLNELA